VYNLIPSSERFQSMSSSVQTQEKEKNPRGIPKAPFVVCKNLWIKSVATDFLKQTDVEKHIGGPDGDVESALRQIQDALAYVCPNRLSLLSCD
jgi:hypothetical protein